MSAMRSPHFANAKTRECLKCDKSFNSKGPENRICDACKANDVFSGMYQHVKDVYGKQTKKGMAAE